MNPKPFGLGFKSSQQQIKVRHCSITVARWRHCSGVWLSLTRVDHAIYRRKIGDLSPNHLYITRNRRFLARNPEISSDRYFSMKYRVETHRYTIFRRYIAEISRYFLPWSLPRSGLRQNVELVGDSNVKNLIKLNS